MLPLTPEISGLKTSPCGSARISHRTFKCVLTEWEAWTGEKGSIQSRRSGNGREVDKEQRTDPISWDGRLHKMTLSIRGGQVKMSLTPTPEFIKTCYQTRIEANLGSCTKQLWWNQKLTKIILAAVNTPRPEWDELRMQAPLPGFWHI